jgi:hypothetical protein
MTQEFKAYLQENRWSALIKTLTGMFVDLKLKKLGSFQLLFELTPNCQLLGITVSASADGNIYIVARGKSAKDKTSPLMQIIGVLGWKQDAQDNTRLVRKFSKDTTDMALALAVILIPDDFYRVPPSTWFTFEAENEALVKTHTRNLWHNKVDGNLLCLPQMNASKTAEG